MHKAVLSDSKLIDSKNIDGGQFTVIEEDGQVKQIVFIPPPNWDGTVLVLNTKDWERLRIDLDQVLALADQVKHREV